MNNASNGVGIEQGLIDIDKYLKRPEECECGGRYIYLSLIHI